MTFQNTVLALLAIVIVSIASHDIRSHHADRADRADCGDHHDARQTRTAPPVVRVARVAKSALADSLRHPARVARLLGLESRGPRIDERPLAELAFGDASHAVLEVRDRGERAFLVVLAE